MHEHIVTRSSGVRENWPHLWDRPEILQIAERKMTDLHGRGIRTIVDLTTVELGLPNRPLSAKPFGSGAEARTRWTGWTKPIVFGQVSWVSPPVSSEPKGSTYLNALMRPHNLLPPWSGRCQQPSCLFQQARLKRLRRQA